MATMARSVTMALTMLWAVHMALGARSDVGKLASDGAALAAGGGQRENSGACPQSLPELPHFSGKIQGQCPASQFGTLYVGCVSASGLKKKHFIRDNRALCRVEMVSKTQTRDSPGGKKPARRSTVLETPVVLGQDPEWKSAFHFGFACADAAEEMQDSMIQVQIKDQDPLVGVKTNLGYAYVDFSRFSDFSGGATGDYDLGGHRAGGAAGSTDPAKGKVKLALRWCPLGDTQCMSDAVELRGLSVAGADWTDCRDGCHNALVEKLTPIYDLERRRMATAVKAAGLAAKYAGTAEKLRREAAELDAWLKQHPVADKWKRWQKPAPTCTPSVHEWDAPDCSDDPLTKEQELALAWQSRARARKRNEAEHKKFKLKEELFRQNETKAYALATAAMDTVGSQLVDGALGVCGKRLAPFMEDAGARIPKMPEGAFEVGKAEEALEQLDAAWASVADLRDCLLAEWRRGDLLPGRGPGEPGGACFEAMAA